MGKLRRMTAVLLTGVLALSLSGCSTNLTDRKNNAGILPFLNNRHFKDSMDSGREAVKKATEEAADRTAAEQAADRAAADRAAADRAAAEQAADRAAADRAAADRAAAEQAADRAAAERAAAERAAEQTSVKNDYLTRAEGIKNYEDEVCAAATDQASINRTANEVFSRWDVLLNDIYQYLKRTMPANEFAALEKDEIRWIKEKEAAIDAAGAECAGGSMEPMQRAATASSYTEKRCYYLISLID